MRRRLIAAMVTLTTARAVSTAWWRSIGSPKHVCAPMVDQSELAFRELSRRYGAGLCYTPMLHAGLAAGESGIQYLERQFTTRRGDWPLSAQFAGHDPSVVCTAAERTLALAGDCADNIVALDLNLGCPQQIARRGRYGAWLWERDADAAVDVIRALRTHFATDERVVTAKVRILPPGDDQAVAETADRCLRLADAGASLICVHGRTREQNKQLSGAANWASIKAVRDALAARDVVTIANGGIGDLQDVSDAFEATGCDAVMSSEGLLANPALFVRNRDADDAYVGARRLAREYLALAEDTGAETSDARGHLFKILHGGLTARVDLRTALSTASSLNEMRAVVDALDQADPDGLLEARHDDPTDRKSWYWRHRVAKVVERDPAIVQARLERKLRKSERRNAARRRAAGAVS